MENRKFYRYIQKVKENENLWYELENNPYIDIVIELCEDVKKLPFYNLAGRFESIFIQLIRKNTYDQKNCYNTFLKDLENEFKKLCKKNIVLLPLNFVKEHKLKPETKISDNMTIYTTSDIRNKFAVENNIFLSKRKKKKLLLAEDLLSSYFKTNLNQDLDKKHILITKDRNFFNFPILAINIENIDSRVESESTNFVEGIYSIIRMSDFNSPSEDEGWGMLDKRNFRNPASTYVIYYNKDFESLDSPLDGYYGYSFRFNFSPILDINTSVLVSKNIEKVSILINLFINSCFLDKRVISRDDLLSINKWKNSILLFNNAYELASKEKYDSSVLILISILESLFLNNEGRNKQERLIQEILNFFELHFSEVDPNKIKDIIEENYKRRNIFMHEGKGYNSEYTTSRRLHDYQGFYEGMKPFSYNGSFKSFSSLQTIKSLFDIIIKIICSSYFIKKLQDIVNKQFN